MCFGTGGNGLYLPQVDIGCGHVGSDFSRSRELSPIFVCKYDAMNDGSSRISVL